MEILQRISMLFEYKFNINLNTRLNRTQAMLLIISFTGLLLVLGNFAAKQVLWSETRSLYQQKIAVLEQGSEKSNNLNNQVELALAYYLQGNNSRAKAIFEEIISQNQDNAAANIYYGMILSDQQSYSAAIPLLEKGLTKEPGREKLAYRYLGESYYQTGQTEQAVQKLKISETIEPGSPLTQYYLGLCYQKLGNFPAARTKLVKALQLTGGNFPEAQKVLGGLPKTNN